MICSSLHLSLSRYLCLSLSVFLSLSLSLFLSLQFCFFPSMIVVYFQPWFILYRSLYILTSESFLFPLDLSFLSISPLISRSESIIFHPVYSFLSSSPSILAHFDLSHILPYIDMNSFFHPLHKSSLVVMTHGSGIPTSRTPADYRPDFAMHRRSSGAPHLSTDSDRQIVAKQWSTRDIIATTINQLLAGLCVHEISLASWRFLWTLEPWLIRWIQSLTDFLSSLNGRRCQTGNIFRRLNFTTQFFSDCACPKPGERRSAWFDRTPLKGTLINSWVFACSCHRCCILTL